MRWVGTVFQYYIKRYLVYCQDNIEHRAGAYTGQYVDLRSDIWWDAQMKRLGELGPRFSKPIVLVHCKIVEKPIWVFFRNIPLKNISYYYYAMLIRITP